MVDKHDGKYVFLADDGTVWIDKFHASGAGIRSHWGNNMTFAYSRTGPGDLRRCDGKKGRWVPWHDAKKLLRNEFAFAPDFSLEEIESAQRLIHKLSS